jgi:zinc protease
VALPNPASGKTLADMESITRASLEEFEKRGVVDDDLERVKMTIVSGMIYGLESVSGKVTQLASYQTYTGNPNFTGQDIARYENVSKDDVMRVYRKYIKDNHAIIMSVVPNGQAAMVAHQDNWTPDERSLPEFSDTTADDLALRHPTDDFDRSVMPPPGANPSVILPPIWRAELNNGVKVLGAVNAETPTTAIQLRIEVGQRNEPLDKLGLAAMTADMLNESTMRHSNEELSNELQKLGSSVSFMADNDYSMLTVRSLTENLDRTLALAAEQLLQPKFDEADFARVRDQTLQSIRHGKTQPATTAATVYQMLLFGRDNSFSYLNIGTEESVVGLTLDDIKAFYRANYSPKIASIVAVSDVPRDAMLAKLSVFQGWSGPDVTTPPLRDFPKLDGNKIYLVDKPGAAQSEIRVGMRSLKYDATGEYYRANLMNYVLGGAFNSRINLNLREDKGYTYGAFSGFAGNRDYGTFTAQASVRTDSTADSIVQIENEIRDYAESGITEPEMMFTRRAIGQSDARSFETPSQKLGFLSQILVYNLQDDFVDRQNQILASIGQDEINALASKLLRLDDMIIVVVGDKQVIMPDLAKLGYPIVELDQYGNPI